MESAIEDMSREEEELRNKRDKAFRKTTEIKRNILDRYSEIIDQEIPSLDEAYSIEDEAGEYFGEYYFIKDKPGVFSVEYEDYRVELETRRHVYLRAMSLANIVIRYHDTMRKAERYHERANKAQEKKGKLIDFKKKYPHL